jgi:branched-chain amino acid transport system ATP-binding protein
MLVIESLRSGYTAIDALKGVSLTVPDDGIVGVLGANGAGKTALLRAISGLNPVRGGRIRFGERDITHASTDDVVRQGIIHVPQGRALFGPMTVRENLDLGAYLERDAALTAVRLRRVFSLFPILEDRQAQAAAYLSGGEQQMLAIARALMASPKLLLLDEPSLGLAPKVFDTILDKVREIHRDGASILIAEQNARKVLHLADHCYVLENGTVAFDGTGPELARDARIEKTYLGAHV